MSGFRFGFQPLGLADFKFLGTNLGTQMVLAKFHHISTITPPPPPTSAQPFISLILPHPSIYIQTSLGRGRELGIGEEKEGQEGIMPVSMV